MALPKSPPVVQGAEARARRMARETEEEGRVIYASTNPFVKLSAHPLEVRRRERTRPRKGSGLGRAWRELEDAKRDRAARRALEQAKGLRAHPGSDASVDGEEDAPRYDQGQLARLEREGKALRKRDGTFGWGCADRRDLMNCLAAFRRGEAGSEASDVKAFLRRRAVLLGYESELPEAWQTKAKPRPHANEMGRA
jgi:hypothetical protein